MPKQLHAREVFNDKIKYKGYKAYTTLQSIDVPQQVPGQSIFRGATNRFFVMVMFF